MQDEKISYDLYDAGTIAYHYEVLHPLYSVCNKFIEIIFSIGGIRVVLLYEKSKPRNWSWEVLGIGDM